jgi:LPPG:FO 2-phospho-L-lactate transferase
MSVLALAGGVGGAKLAAGLADALPPGELTVIVNTGDDFEHLGLSISPDIDTVTYTLAGINNQEQGWGLAGETWSCMSALERLGGETWFRLGDQDIATHLERTRRLKTEPLSQITADFARRLGIRQKIAPMTDYPVRTMVETDVGLLPFQEYFVRLKCAPKVERLAFSNLDAASPSPAFAEALADPALSAIIVCPSNPFLSILPILALAGVRTALENRRAPLVAVSPIVGGKAIKGPAAKNMEELGLRVSCVGIAEFYGSLLDGLVIDAVDAHLAAEIAGPTVVATPSIMRTAEDRRSLALAALALAERLRT